MASENKKVQQKTIIGKTYSLYGGELSSDNYYNQLFITANEILALPGRSENEVLDFISSISRSKRRIKQYEINNYDFSSIMKILRRDLSKYLVNVESHLKSISFIQL